MSTTTATDLFKSVNRKARKIALAAAGRSLAQDAVWVESTTDGYKVYFLKPRTEGFFICDEPLAINAIEFYGYTETRNAR